MVTPIEGIQNSEMSPGLPILGFRSVLAPINKITHTQNAMFFDSGVRRHVNQLPRYLHEKAHFSLEPPGETSGTISSGRKFPEYDIYPGVI